MELTNIFLQKIQKDFEYRAHWHRMQRFWAYGTETWDMRMRVGLDPITFEEWERDGEPS